MAKTYTLVSTASKGGMNTAWTGGDWNNYYFDNNSGETRRCGQTATKDRYCATYYMFDAATLATLKQKTITSVKLTITVTDGTGIPSGTSDLYAIREKVSNSAGSGSSSSAWQGGSTVLGWVRRASGSSTTFDCTLSNTIPSYGYVLGAYAAGYGQYLVLASTATLTVTTNEVDYTYTLSYNENGGSGAPSSQSQTVTASSTPSMTFTISSTSPSRTGYTFQGWATSSSATSASYQPNGSISVSGNTTLYAVWKVITYTVSYNANGGSGAPSAQTKTYGVALTLSATVPTRSGYLFQGWATSSTGAVAYQPSGSYTNNASAVLYAIWKAANSTLSSVDNTNIGSSGTASWNKIDNSYTYKLVLTYSNAPSVTVNVAANNSSTSFTIPTTWYAYLPNSTSATATATLTTYSGSTALGTSSKNFTVSVASSIKPSISAFTASPASSNTTVNEWNIYVQGYSYVHLAATATAGTGASIVSYAFSGAGLSQTGTSNTANSQVIDSSGAKTYTLRVTDTRGRWIESTVSASFVAYSSPTVTSLTSYRSNSSGTQSDIDGTYIHSTPVFTFSEVGSNALSVKKIEYKLHTASSWTTGVSSATSGTGYTFGGGNIAITSSYDVKCTVTDSLGNSGTLTVLVPPIVGFSIGLNNDRARFGGPVEKAGLQIDWATEINNTLDVTPRRCYATLSRAGWYRSITFTSGTSQTNGQWGNLLDITVSSSADTTQNNSHRITLALVRGNIKFLSETSVTNVLNIDKIRYTQGTSAAYVDIHYVGNTANNVWVGFDVSGTGRTYFTASNLSPVDPSPSGETVLAEYTFSENGAFSKVFKNAGGTTTLQFEPGQKAFIVLTGAGSNHELLIVNNTSSGTVTYQRVLSNGNYTYSTGTNTLTITNASSYVVTGLIIYF